MPVRPSYPEAILPILGVQKIGGVADLFPHNRSLAICIGRSDDARRQARRGCEAHGQYTTATEYEGNLFPALMMLIQISRNARFIYVTHVYSPAAVPTLNEQSGQSIKPRLAATTDWL